MYHFSFAVFSYCWALWYLFFVKEKYVFMYDLGAEVGGDLWGASDGHRGRELTEEQVCLFGGETKAGKGPDWGGTLWHHTIIF